MLHRVPDRRSRYLGWLAGLTASLSLVAVGSRPALAAGDTPLAYSYATQPLVPLPREEPTELAPLRVRVGARTDAPLFVGGYAGLEHVSGLRLTTALGVLPTVYARGMNSVLRGVGAYDQRIGDALDASLRTSLAWRTHAGFRPFADHGFVVETGYGLVTLEAGGDSVALVAQGANVDVSALAGLDSSFAIRSKLHMLDLGLGWEWPLEDHFVIGASFGISWVFSSSTAVSADNPIASSPRVAPVLLAAEQRLDGLYASYGVIPTAGISLGYRF
jgi:hypothetical protein